jgi:hypothetical protein
MQRPSWTTLAALLAALAMTPWILWAAGDEGAAAEAWARSMTPGSQHARLAERAGEWRATVTIWSAPGAEPTVLEGTSTKTMTLNGRYLEETFTGEIMGRPFRGHGITGFDNVTKRYVSIWYDNMGTGIHVSEGGDDGKGGLAFTSTRHDPVTGKPVEQRSTGRRIDGDHHSWESFERTADGKEYLHMRVEYTRLTP